jgi:hypothetical protein
MTSRKSCDHTFKAVDLAQQCKPLIEAFVSAIDHYEEGFSIMKSFTNSETSAILETLRYNLRRATLHKNNEELFHFFLIGTILEQEEQKDPLANIADKYQIPGHDYDSSKLMSQIFRGRPNAIRHLEEISIGALRSLTRRKREYIIKGVLGARPHPSTWDLLEEFKTEKEPISEEIARENQIRRKKTAAEELLDTCDPVWDLWTDPDLDPRLQEIFEELEAMPLEDIMQVDQCLDDLEVYGDVNLEYQWD